MNVLLMDRERDFDASRSLPWNFDDVVADLGLSWIFDAMAGGDEVIDAVVRRAFAGSLTDVDAILYRQAALKDALRNPEAVRALYDLASSTVEDERKHYFGLLKDHPDTILRRSVEVMAMFAERLRALRTIAEQHVTAFESEAFDRLFLEVQTELDDTYLARIDAHLKDLRFRGGIPLSARLGPGNVGSEYVLREPNEPEGGFFKRLLTRGPATFSFTIPERDEGGFRALDELRDRGVNDVANALAQSNDHILGFFRALRDELAFYVGAIRLHGRLAAKREPTCMPSPRPTGEGRRTFQALYDPALSLQIAERTVPNDLDADGKDLIVTTGANHGGKSTFLRALGIAQLMTQCGLFAPAHAATLSVSAGLYSHFKREEDVNLESGKFDEELARMSDIVEQLEPGSLLLLNESFSSTNEREGSEIARQIVSTLLERGVSIHFVTHLYDFARSMHETRDEHHLFLRVSRSESGARSFKLEVAAPLPTSFGEDLYQEVFGEAPGDPEVAPAAPMLGREDGAPAEGATGND